MKLATEVQPVRYEPGKGWFICEPHRAQRWRAVFKGRVLDKAPWQATKAKAMSLLTTNALRHAPLARDYKLGKQMERRS